MIQNRNPLPISVCMMCLNEGHRMESALQQIGEFAEWIVLDTGSSDDTVARAGQLGATVRTTRWAGYSETRREHFQMASQPWILWIDADEIVTPEIVDELRGLFANGAPDHAGYRISRVMYFESRWIRFGDWYPDRVTRLFRADSWSIEKKEVHESVRIDGTTGRLDSELPHFSYEGWKDRTLRIARYAQLWAAQESSAGRGCTLASAAARSCWRFFRNYILKGGVMGGVLGARIAGSCAKEVWLKYAALAPGRRAVGTHLQREA
ncbi:glycosyltransferase family 2 protein [Luteolibacter sp. SL250]|uniref:glycosyltransferase family 2 protein n=1 Tax=Luteolibacter sp. SL250 TaxID=2995170 RepID=UPI002270C8A5|nr:glycosyltransferase family 2 protein [Luteolibacter sp. SL250]WAC19811.1 glycosyltransferase family 2 protein [Luteolibacter sp. SL250]